MSDINVALLQTPASFRYKQELFNEVELMLNKESMNFNLICLPELFASNVNLINLDEIGEGVRGETFQFLSKIAFVYNNNGHYKEKLDKIGFNDKNTFEEFQKIDCLTKDELRGNPYLILSVDKEDISQLHTSTGTTGGDNIYI